MTTTTKLKKQVIDLLVASETLRSGVILVNGNLDTKIANPLSINNLSSVRVSLEFIIEDKYETTILR